MAEKWTEFLTSTHPEYQANVELWNSLDVAYEGGLSAIQQFLQPFEKEEKKQLANRQNRIAYENHFEDIVSRRESLVWRRDVKRTIKLRLWEMISENADGRGGRWEQVIKRCFRHSQRRGFLPVFVDSTATGDEKTKHEENQAGAHPYLIPIMPQNFTNWHLDENGKLLWCIIKSYRYSEVEPPEKPERIVEYRFVDRDSVTIYVEAEGKEKKTELIQDGSVNHGLGIVPVVILNDRARDDEEAFVGSPSLKGAVDLSVQYLNRSSLLDQILFNTNFATLAVPEDRLGKGADNESTNVETGTQAVIPFPADGSPPLWISPDTGPADVLENNLEGLRQRIYEKAELDVGEKKSRQAMSGEAYARRSKPTEDMAKRLGKTMQTFELECLELLALRSGDKSAKFTVQYPSQYGIKALSEVLEELSAIEESESMPPEVVKEIAKQIVFTSAFADLSDERQKELEELIEKYDINAAKIQQILAEEEARVSAKAPEREAEMEMRKLESQKQNSGGLLSGL